MTQKSTSSAKNPRNLDSSNQDSFIFQGTTEQDGAQTGRGHQTSRSTARAEKEKAEFYKAFNNPWEGIEKKQETDRCNNCKTKDKTITSLQEELIASQKRLFSSQEEIAVLT